MIRIPTTFVLGAGASWYYGLPLGHQQKEQILTSLANEGSRIYRCINTQYDSEDIEAFVEGITKAHLPSIDYCLAEYEEDHEFRKLGKMAIAFNILSQEKITSIRNAEKNWFETISVLMKFDGMSLIKSLTDLLRSQADFITFNYDRSLEFLFRESIHSYCAKRELDISEGNKALENLRIFHIHGKVGSLIKHDVARIPYDISDLLPYPEDEELVDYIIQASQSIHLPDEEVWTQDLGQAHESIKTSERLYFMGFAYQEENLKKLYPFRRMDTFTTGGHSLDSLAEKLFEKMEIIGTAINVNNRVKSIAQSHFSNRIQFADELYGPDIGVYEFISRIPFE